MAENQLVVFGLGNEEYAVPIEQVREIMVYRGATALPNTPPYLAGCINLRGKVIPVIDLAVKMGKAVGDGEKQVIVVETGSGMTGCIVDHVNEVTKIEDANIEPPGEMMASGDYVSGIAKREDRLLILLDLAALTGRGEAITA